LGGSRTGVFYSEHFPLPGFKAWVFELAEKRKITVCEVSNM